MNERIKELAEYAGIEWIDMSNQWVADDEDIERFSKLLLNDEPQNSPKWEGMKPIDGELRIKAGIKLSHKDPYCMEGVDMARGKMYSPLEALQNYADLIREDEREAIIKIVMQNVSPAMARGCEDDIRARSNNRTKTSRDICGNE